jgi:hypothetical protein
MASLKHTLNKLQCSCILAALSIVHNRIEDRAISLDSLDTCTFGDGPTHSVCKPFTTNHLFFAQPLHYADCTVPDLSSADIRTKNCTFGGLLSYGSSCEVFAILPHLMHFLTSDIILGIICINVYGL